MNNNNIIDILKIEALKPPAMLRGLTSQELDRLKKNPDHTLLGHTFTAEAVKYAIEVTSLLREIDLASRQGDCYIYVRGGKVISHQNTEVG